MTGEYIVNGIDVGDELQDAYPKRDFWPENKRTGMNIITRSPDIYVSVTGVSTGNGLSRRCIALKRKPVEYTEEGTSCTTDDIDLISNMEITSGPEQPFEMVEIDVGAKAFNTVYEDFFTNYDIRPGVSVISITGMVPDNQAMQLDYTVTSFSKNSDKISITAYCSAESMCSSSVGSSVAILIDSDSESGVADAVWNIVSGAGNWGFTDRDTQFVTNVGKRNRKAEYSSVSGANTWIVLQALAIMARARIFFAEGKVFLIDYTKVDSDGSGMYFDKDVALSYPPSSEDYSGLYDSVIGGVSVTNNGTSSISNKVSVLCLDYNGTLHGAYWYDTRSGGKYNAVVESTLDMTEVIVSGDNSVNTDLDTKKMAKFAALYRSLAQSDMTFSVAEGYSIDSELCWSRTFPQAYAVKGMRDPESGTYSSAIVRWPAADDPSAVDVELRPQTMLLSRMVTSYPSMRTKYTFGTVSSVSLAQKTSEIVTNQESSSSGAVASSISGSGGGGGSSIRNRAVYITDRDGHNGGKVNLVGVGDMKLRLPPTISVGTVNADTSTFGTMSAGTIIGHASEDQYQVAYNELSETAPEGSVAVMPRSSVGADNRPVYIDGDGNFKQCSNILRNVTVSTSEPTSEQGDDGDIWFTY